MILYLDSHLGMILSQKPDTIAGAFNHFLFFDPTRKDWLFFEVEPGISNLKKLFDAFSPNKNKIPNKIPPTSPPLKTNKHQNIPTSHPPKKKIKQRFFRNIHHWKVQNLSELDALCLASDRSWLGRLMPKGNVDGIMCLYLSVYVYSWFVCLYLIICVSVYIYIFATFVVVVVFVSIPLLFAVCFKITVSLNVGPSVD